MKVKQFIPILNTEAEIDSLLNKSFLSLKPLPSFDEQIIGFLSKLSVKILDYKEIKSYPELVALAFWLRKSNLRKIITDFKNNIKKPDAIVPRGVVFHIAPSNVDSIFLYSWALSLLSGNINVIRISRNMNPQLDLLLNLIRELIGQKEWSLIKDRNLVVSYPRDKDINTYISLRADVRLLWGGDRTISDIKILPAKPGTKDIVFTDKFSCSVINSTIYNSLEEKEKKLISRNFFNDAYWFNQTACSSPRFVIFTGNGDECEASSKSFWALLEVELKQRNISDSQDVAMEKMVYFFETISKTDLLSAPEQLNSRKPAVLRVSKEEIKTSRESCGGGFFFECFLNSLNELVPFVNMRDQTLTYFGFYKDELISFAADVNGSGIDRIVPVGQALNFSPNWDGYSLLYELTKLVKIIV